MIHNHQPVDNDDEIIEGVYRKSYKPFIDLLFDHPNVAINLHYTGSLLDWLELNHPEYIEKLHELAYRNQVEMIGGGHHEPILTVIPEVDSRGQIAKLDKTLARLFGQKSRGFWTAERAWEPQIPETLEKCGLTYTLLDDDIFHGAGIAESDCFKPYLAESRGATTAVFPMLKKLRYFIPFKPVDSTIGYLKSSARQGRKIAVYADDGEKFGAWPTTYETVYGSGWLESFFEILEKEVSWLKTIKLSDYLRDNPAHDRIYLPTSSYPELMEWSLPASKKTRNAGRGFWRMFLAKYPESARMYSRMLRVSKTVHRLGDHATDEMLDELWKGQCNDAYWHGIFGGLYASTLRRVTQGHLIGAQTMAEAAMNRGNFVSVEKPEFDGSSDVLANTRTLGVLASPRFGGSLVELDYKPKRVNFFDTLSRRRERYHDLIIENTKTKASSKEIRSIHDPAVAKEEGLTKLLVYDNGPRYSFLDHFLKHGTRPYEFENTAPELSDPYVRYGTRVETTDKYAKIHFWRTTSFLGKKISVQKMFLISGNSSLISAKYELKYEEGNEPLNFSFCPEINAGCLGDQTFIRRNGRTKELRTTTKHSLNYPKFGADLELGFSVPDVVLQFPVRTVSQSESGYESNLQGVAIWPIYDVELAAGKKFTVEIKVAAASH